MLSVLITNEKGHRKLLEVMDMMMVSQTYAYSQTHLIVHFKYVQFFGTSVIPQ